jgi:hypothetical protein
MQITFKCLGRQRAEKPHQVNSFFHATEEMQEDKKMARSETIDTAA